jgi:hypothetical protein
MVKNGIKILALTTKPPGYRGRIYYYDEKY